MKYRYFTLLLAMFVAASLVTPAFATDPEISPYEAFPEEETAQVDLPALDETSEDTNIIAETNAEYQDLHISILAGIIFFLGVLAGLVFIKILFDRIRTV